MLIGRLHVFEDLLPYICTFAGCREELRQFPSRRAWAEHEHQEHRSYVIWMCPECPEECSSIAAWSRHVEETHGRKFAALQTSSAVDAACRRKQQPFSDERCFLCKEELAKSERNIRTYVGRHMEEIALMALPKEYQEDSDAPADSDDDASAEMQGKAGPSELEFKCPFRNCELGYCSKWKLDSHILTHYKGRIVCGFCLGYLAPTSFNRADVFQRHLESVHGAGSSSSCGDKRYST